MTAICVIGIELSARTAGRPAGRRDRHAGRSSRSSRSSRSTPATAPAGAIDPSLSWFNPFALSPQRGLTAGDAARRSSSTGAGTRPSTVNEETEDSDEAPGQGDRDQHPDPARDLRRRRRRGSGATPGSTAGRQPRRRAQRARRRRSSARRSDKILIIAVLTSARGLDPDDDPAGRPHHSLDGPGQGDAGEPRQRSIRATSPRTSRRSGWASLSIVWYVGLDAGQRRHPLRLARRAGR